MNPSHPRRGFTLTEMAIVMVVIGVVLGGIWIAVSGVNKSMKINQADRQLQVIVSNIRALYATRGAISGTNMQDITIPLFNAGIFPSDMPMVGAYPQNPWGGATGINAQGNCFNGPYGGGQCDSGSFEIQVVNPGTRGAWWQPVGAVPCAALLASVTGTNADKGLTAIYTQTEGWLDPATFDPSMVSPNCLYVALAFRLLP